MKYKWKHASLSAAALLMLSACGTAEETENPEDTQMKQEETDHQNQGTEEGTEQDSEQTAGDKETTDDEGTDDQQDPSESAEERGPERELTYQSGDDQQSAQAKLTKSDEMNYSIYVLDGYQLTSEEPNKDVLYWNENDQVFMRIETFGTDADYSMLTDQMIGSLEFDGGQSKDVSGEYSLAGASDVEELVIRQLENEEGLTTGAVFMRDGMTVRLTVFDKLDASQTDALLSMGATIAQK